MKVISLVDRDYFDFGRFFLATRKLVDADFVVYGSCLTSDQKFALKEANISLETVPKKEFETKMQFLKFKMLLEHPGEHRTLVDWDTLFLKDWNKSVFGTEFDLGITVRNKDIRTGGLSQGSKVRSFSNGGVIFCGKNSSADEICQFAIQVMEAGKSRRLPEYDFIFRTGLEENRPKHKTWHRENLRWWCDQVFLSSLVLHHFKNAGKKAVRDHRFFNFEKFNVGLFNCDRYNFLDPPPSAVMGKKAYILHLKNQGRSVLKSYGTAVKSLMRNK